MTNSVIAKVAVEKTAYHFDKEYDYLVTDPLLSKAEPGMRVIVPFGAGNRKRQGIIMKLSSSSSTDRIKPIISVLDKEPLLTGEMIELAYWLKERTFCTLFDAVKSLLPAGINLRMEISYKARPEITEEDIENLRGDDYLMCRHLIRSKATVVRERLLEVMNLPKDSEIPEKLVKKGYLIRFDNPIRKVGDASTKMAKLNLLDYELDDVVGALTKKQLSVVDMLLEAGSASIKEICYYCGVTESVTNTLIRKGILDCYEEEFYRLPKNINLDDESPEESELTDEQEAAYESLLELYKGDEGAASLLYGVTGSGKTQVIMKLIENAVSNGQGVIMMVPEIGLTPQVLKLFYAKFKDKVAIFHSALSLGERLDEWKRVKNGEALVAVGTRSAVFAPFDKIGLIVMDEEHDGAYKSEAAPRFHARDVARFRCVKHRALLILSSATPSLESYSAAKSGRYSLNVIKSRYGDATLPEVITVDMREELAKGNSNSISEKLRDELLKVKEQNLQSILLMNRRGYHTYASCRSCGYVAMCPSCSISLTYHSANGMLMCHYCGHSVAAISACPSCGENKIKYTGIGTQKLEEELQELIPDARILRIDADTTMTKHSHEKNFMDFADGKYDIMLGTQMVAKGLDFSRVVLAGIISADQSLYNDDFRSLEKTYSLLTQVIGRSGRGNHKGTAIIQTFTPDNPIIKMAEAQRYEDFYSVELETRRLMAYPPFCDICVIGFSGKEQERVKECSESFFRVLISYSRNEYRDEKIIVLGPSAARVLKVSSKYRYRIIIKCKNRAGFREMISRLLIEFGKDDKRKNISIFADMNPENLL